jgi:hypothetical protein
MGEHKYSQYTALLRPGSLQCWWRTKTSLSVPGIAPQNPPARSQHTDRAISSYLPNEIRDLKMSSGMLRRAVSYKLTNGSRVVTDITAVMRKPRRLRLQGQVGQGRSLDGPRDERDEREVTGWGQSEQGSQSMAASGVIRTMEVGGKNTKCGTIQGDLYSRQWKCRLWCAGLWHAVMLVVANAPGERSVARHTRLHGVSTQKIAIHTSKLKTQRQLLRFTATKTTSRE